MQVKKANPQIDEQVILGLDIGIGSVGWCLIKENIDIEKTQDEMVFELLASSEAGGQIVPSLGARCMDVPENAKDKSLLNKKRRTARGARRTVKRRANRMNAVRRLIAESFYADVLDITTFHQVDACHYNPWNLRKEGLSRLLSEVEFATVLVHLCKHRGFKSNSKKDAADKESSLVLGAIKNTKEQMDATKASTFGAYMAKQTVQRNRQGFDGSSNYTYTPSRILLVEEAHILFNKQRELGNSFARKALEDAFVDAAFTQRPLKPVTHAIGKCVFLEDQPRAPACSPTAERFRLAQRLTTLKIQEGTNTRNLDTKEIRHVLLLLGKQKGVTYKALRKHLGLNSKTEFVGLSTKGKEKDPESKDVTGRSVGCGLASYTLFKCLGEENYARLRDVKMETGFFCLDIVAKILSEFDGIDVIAEELQKLPLMPKEFEALRAGVQEGDFAQFKGTANLSLKAMYLVVPHMIEACDYAMGCELAGFDHTKVRPVDVSDIKNPVVAKVLSEVRRQVRAIIREFNVIPGRVHIELLRDVGKSVEVRNSIESGQEKQRNVNEQARKELADIFGDRPENISGTELRRYALWEQQGGKCAYHLLCSEAQQKDMYKGDFKNGGIPVGHLRDAMNTTEIDHILPFSRTSDNSLHNQALCIAGANQKKGRQTPYEWLGKQSPIQWHAYKEWVKDLRVSGFKKRNLLMQDLDGEKENVFHARNLNDSRYAARMSMQIVREELLNFGADFTYDDGSEKRRIFARPGAVTGFLRRNWGVNSLKYRENADGHEEKDANKNKIRTDDRNHALDAMVIAMCSEGMLQRITKIFQAAEKTAKIRKIIIPKPQLILPENIFFTQEAQPQKNKEQTALSLREGAVKALDATMVSRAERAKTKGALHEETLRSIRIEEAPNGKEIQMLYERKNVNSLAIKDLENIKDPHRNQEIIEALREWMRKGKPKEDPPFVTQVVTQGAHTGKEIKNIIRRVQVRRGKFTSGITVTRGSGVAQVDNASWVRADVYTSKGKYYVVPVYTWQVAAGILPNKAIVAHKPEEEWTVVDASFAFCFSLSSNAYVVAQNKKKVIQGYYSGMNRSTANMDLVDVNDREKKMNIGTKTLSAFHKYRVDRMGRLHLVRTEVDPRSIEQGGE